MIILDSPAPLVGGYPGAYGLIGALTYIRWMNLGFAGENQMRAFGFVGVLLAIQLLFALIDGRYENVISDMSGFVAGFLLSFVVSPGGVARLLARLRQR